MMSLTLPGALTVVRGMTVVARVSGVLVTAPGFSSNQIPRRFRIGVALVISAVIIPTLPDSWSPAVFAGHTSPFTLALLLGAEFLMGFTVSVFVLTVVETVSFAGGTVDINAGFAMAQSVDPSGEHSGTVFSVLFSQLFIILFFTLDAHHDLIRLIAHSFRTIGPGQFALTEGIYLGVTETSAAMFSEGFRMALPVFTALLCINVAMGFIAKFGQEFNVLMLSFPIRIGTGLLVLSASIPLVVQLIRGHVGSLLEWIEALLGGA